ncbi:nuclear transport factor 2 family protein [Flavihumibacter petaseus]|uniref:DUF4440 domain-containing protein n=1 Tax=Flavihumibacter petaseus NBRC 106054 TaxID=1220578 RepID=A0A0E9MZN7_9BACT|nr:nuclear transport factor 2 family protein [Flavihumibacter petaseus]GAO43029.1 hypothetical protein FPE01S_02_01340 [Flavihumibacter petaseus NBRC 106054]
MKTSIIVAFLFIVSVTSTYAQASDSSTFTRQEQELVSLSKDKWQWMADKNVDKLALLFHDKAKFVHMSGTWKKDEELEIIKSGTIWYKKATLHDTAVEITEKTGIVWNRLTLESVVRGSDAKVEFTVTEVYIKEGGNWKMLALTFSSVRDTHVIKH